MKNFTLPEKAVALGTARSVIRETFEYGNMRKAQIGAENVFDFSLGNPSTPPPKHLNEVLAELIANENSLTLHGYTSSAGAVYARKAAAKAESARAGYDFPYENIYMTCGAAASLTVTLNALICEGERIILLAPYFPEYKVFAEKAGAQVAVVPPVKDTMMPDLEALEKEVRLGAKAVVINSPNNPSGAVYSADTLAKIADILRASENRIFLISDEPYRELVYGDIPVPYVPAFYEDTVICYSFSKSLSVPGERIGYIAIPPCMENANTVFAAVCGAGRALGYVCAPTLFQRVITECIDDKPDLSEYIQNRKLLYSTLTGLGFECINPDGAFYLFVKVPDSLTANKLCEIARKYELLLVASDSFGVDGYIRISYCVSHDTVLRSVPAFEKLAAEIKL